MADNSGRTVTISIRRPSKSPPVFVAASFTEPAWEPLELDAKPFQSPSTAKTPEEAIQGVDESSPAEYEFSRTFKVADGRHQYKFRLGLDSWIYNEQLETAVDREGNTNNVLVVEPPVSPTTSTAKADPSDKGDAEGAPEENKEDEYDPPVEGQDENIQINPYPADALEDGKSPENQLSDETKQNTTVHGVKEIDDLPAAQEISEGLPSEPSEALATAPNGVVPSNVSSDGLEARSKNGVSEPAETLEPVEGVELSLDSPLVEVSLPPQPDILREAEWQDGGLGPERPATPVNESDTPQETESVTGQQKLAESVEPVREADTLRNAESKGDEPESAKPGQPVIESNVDLPTLQGPEESCDGPEPATLSKSSGPTVVDVSPEADSRGECSAHLAEARQAVKEPVLVSDPLVQETPTQLVSELRAESATVEDTEQKVHAPGSVEVDHDITNQAHDPGEKEIEKPMIAIDGISFPDAPSESEHDHLVEPELVDPVEQAAQDSKNMEDVHTPPVSQPDNFVEPEPVTGVEDTVQGLEKAKAADVQQEQVPGVLPEPQTEQVLEAVPESELEAAAEPELMKAVEQVLQEQESEIASESPRPKVAAESGAIRDFEQVKLAEDIRREQAPETSTKADEIHQQEIAGIVGGAPLEEARNSYENVYVEQGEVLPESPKAAEPVEVVQGGHSQEEIQSGEDLADPVLVEQVQTQPDVPAEEAIESCDLADHQAVVLDVINGGIADDIPISTEIQPKTEPADGLTHGANVPEQQSDSAKEPPVIPEPVPIGLLDANVAAVSEVTQSKEPGARATVKDGGKSEEDVDMIEGPIIIGQTEKLIFPPAEPPSESESNMAEHLTESEVMDALTQSVVLPMESPEPQEPEDEPGKDATVDDTVAEAATPPISESTTTAQDSGAVPEGGNDVPGADAAYAAEIVPTQGAVEEPMTEGIVTSPLLDSAKTQDDPGPGSSSATERSSIQGAVRGAAAEEATSETMSSVPDSSPAQDTVVIRTETVIANPDSLSAAEGGPIQKGVEELVTAEDRNGPQVENIKPLGNVEENEEIISKQESSEGSAYTASKSALEASEDLAMGPKHDENAPSPVGKSVDVAPESEQQIPKDPVFSQHFVSRTAKDTTVVDFVDSDNMPGIPSTERKEAVTESPEPGSEANLPVENVLPNEQPTMSPVADTFTGDLSVTNESNVFIPIDKELVEGENSAAESEDVDIMLTSKGEPVSLAHAKSETGDLLASVPPLSIPEEQDTKESRDNRENDTVIVEEPSASALSETPISDMIDKMEPSGEIIDKPDESGHEPPEVETSRTDMLISPAETSTGIDDPVAVRQDKPDDDSPDPQSMAPVESAEAMELVDPVSITEGVEDLTAQVHEPVAVQDVEDTQLLQKVADPHIRATEAPTDAETEPPTGPREVVGEDKESHLLEHVAPESATEAEGLIVQVPDSVPEVPTTESPIKQIGDFQSLQKVVEFDATTSKKPTDPKAELSNGSQGVIGEDEEPAPSVSVEPGPIAEWKEEQIAQAPDSAPEVPPTSPTAVRDVDDVQKLQKVVEPGAKTVASSTDAEIEPITEPKEAVGDSEELQPSAPINPDSRTKQVTEPIVQAADPVLEDSTTQYTASQDIERAKSWQNIAQGEGSVTDAAETKQSAEPSQVVSDGDFRDVKATNPVESPILTLSPHTPFGGQGSGQSEESPEQRDQLSTPTDQRMLKEQSSYPMSGRDTLNPAALEIEELTSPPDAVSSTEYSSANMVERLDAETPVKEDPKSEAVLDAEPTSMTDGVEAPSAERGFQVTHGQGSPNGEIVAPEVEGETASRPDAISETPADVVNTKEVNAAKSKSVTEEEVPEESKSVKPLSKDQHLTSKSECNASPQSIKEDVSNQVNDITGKPSEQSSGPLESKAAASNVVEAADGHKLPPAKVQDTKETLISPAPGAVISDTVVAPLQVEPLGSPEMLIRRPEMGQGQTQDHDAVKQSPDPLIASDVEVETAVVADASFPVEETKSEESRSAKAATVAESDKPSIPKTTETTAVDAMEPTANGSSAEPELPLLAPKVQTSAECGVAAILSEPALAPAPDAAAESGVERRVDGNQRVTENATEEPRPATANHSITSTSLITRKRGNIFKAIWRAIFINFFGGLFAALRRRERTRQALLVTITIVAVPLVALCWRAYDR